MNNSYKKITINKWIDYATKLLSHTKTPKLDSYILLSYVLNKSTTWIKLFNDIILNNRQIISLEHLLFRRINYEPIAYIVQTKEFWSLPFFVSKHVLIPRPDTEILVESALSRIHNKSNVLDLGVGCGNIAIAISNENRNCNIVGIDYNPQAIQIAKNNAKYLQCENISFFCSNWFSNIHTRFDIIVSNPPYLSYYDKIFIDEDVFYEPYHALFALKNGLEHIEHIIIYAKKYLLNNGWLLIEHGFDQCLKVQELFKNNNFYNIKYYKDYSNIIRVTVGQKKYE